MISFLKPGPNLMTLLRPKLSEEELLLRWDMPILKGSFSRIYTHFVFAPSREQALEAESEKFWREAEAAALIVFLVRRWIRYNFKMIFCTASEIFFCPAQSVQTRKETR